MDVSELPLRYRFPDGRRKALLMSYDDGSEHDRRLVDIFNRYGIRASFHLNSGRLGQPHHVARGELRTLYRGHEVSSHSVSHPHLGALGDDELRREILDDRHALEDLTGTAVRGLAYPFGTYDKRVIGMLPALGIDYARTVICTRTFRVPERFLEWETTCHHNQALDVAESFLAEDGPEPAVMSVWGHSYELDGFMSGDPCKNWDYMETFCRLVQGNDSIYYATFIEIVDYLSAMRRLERSQSGITNLSGMPLWINWRGTDIELAPGASVPFDIEHQHDATGRGVAAGSRSW